MSPCPFFTYKDKFVAFFCTDTQNSNIFHIIAILTVTSPIVINSAQKRDLLDVETTV